MKIGAIILLVALAACSSDPAKPAATEKTAQASDASGTICTYEKPVNSFLKEKHCTTAAERAAGQGQLGVQMDTRNERDAGIQ
jgi:hypothetical protein